MSHAGHADAARETRRPKRDDRFTHARFLDLDAPSTDRVPARCVVTGTRRWGPGETDRTVYFTYAKVWDAGEHHGAYRFELAKADESVLEWL
jgi:hypothetical protein